MRFLKKCEVYILVVDPSENGPALYRLVEASGVDAERHLMSRFSIVFVLKSIKHLEMHNGKLGARNNFDSFVLRDWGNLHILELTHISAA